MHRLIASVDRPAYHHIHCREYQPKTEQLITQSAPYPEYDACLGQRQEARTRYGERAFRPDLRVRC